ncbi:MAG: hypothetical protein ACJ8BF_03700 [Gemmatimonadales bacterium]
MNASQLRSFGSFILSEPYICAFLMYDYNAAYLARSDVTAALAELREKAEARPIQTCRRP